MNTSDRKTGQGRNPGDPEPRTLLERTIRVDQAGEFGAVRIYEGQLAGLRWTGRGRGEASRKIAAMALSEREHNRTFNRLIVERRVRPAAVVCRLAPGWLCAGRGDRTDGREGGDGLHRRGRGERSTNTMPSRPPLWETTRPSCAPPSRRSAPTRSATRTRTPRQFGPTRQRRCASRALGSFGQRACAVTETCGNDNGGGTTLRAGGFDERRHLPRGRSDDDNIRRLGQVCNAFDRLEAVDLAVVGIDEVNGPGKSSRANVVQDGAPD